MNTYAAPQAGTASARVDPAAPRSIPNATQQPQQPPATPAASMAYVPASAVRSSVHHHTPLQPHRHHPIVDASWHDHHTRLKPSHIPPPRLPPPPTQPSQVPAHHPVPEKPSSLDPHARPSHVDSRAHEQSHVSARPAAPTHSYHHAVNVIAPPHPSSRLAAPPHHSSYLYPVHQLVAPVAHVPIGAAHYAHLPPSIWGPPHTQYHQHTHPQAHHAHHMSPAVPSHLHGHPQYSHVHHMTAPPHPTAHTYAITSPHATSAHPPPPGPPHAMHPATHHPHHVSYTFTHLQAPPTTHHAAKTAIAIPSSQRIAVGPPLPYSMPSTHASQAVEGAVLSAQYPYKYEAVHPHASSSGQASGQNSNGFSPEDRERAHLEANGHGPDSDPGSNDIEDRTDSSSPKLAKIHSERGEGFRSYQKAIPDQSKESLRKEKLPLVPGQPIRKPRKPYTIKKSREVWTQEEHGRFLQALQLYDRDWKKIEAYIGTKTVLQIRSHAQKHFGKVAKYKTGEYIPPPRPKKRAVLPYPRSRSVGPSKSHSANGSAGEAGSEKGPHSGSAMNAKSGTGASLYSPEEKPGLLEVSAKRAIVEEGDARGQRSISEKPHFLRIEDPLRQSPSPAHEGRYPANAYGRERDMSKEEVPQHCAFQRKAALPRWHSATRKAPPPVRENLREAIHGSSISKDAPCGTGGYSSQPHVHHPPRSSCTEDRRKQESQSEREYSQVASEPAFDKGAPKHDGCEGSPTRHSTNQISDYDSTRTDGSKRKKIAVPSNSLLVLSNCIDLLSRDTPPERPPASGWASAAAARRAHRAKIIRGRKPPLSQPPTPAQSEDPRIDRNESSQAEVNSEAFQEGPGQLTPDQEDRGRKSDIPHLGGRSPPVESPAEYECDRAPLDPQRSSTGSGTGSDDAVAGFSSSDRPSVSGSVVGSGTGGSRGTSDAGDTEEEPKSSNDGSGDDGRRQGPPTRDSSPADPTSSGSRENSPTECLPSEENPDANPRPTSAQTGKEAEGNGVAIHDGGVSHGRANKGCTNLGIETGSNHGNGTEVGYGVGSDGDRDARTRIVECKPQHFHRIILADSCDIDVPVNRRSPTVDHECQRHPDVMLPSPSGNRKRPRMEMGFDGRNQIEHQFATDADQEPQRQRMWHPGNETDHAADQRESGRGLVESTTKP